MRAIDGDILEKKLKDAINMCVSIDTSGLSELKAVLEDVEEMPTIEPEPHWIPCSERLPKYEEEVIPDKINEPAKRLNDLIFDINPAEICAQIEADNLKKWCEIIQVEMKMAMVQLPCWSREDGAEQDG